VLTEDLLLGLLLWRQGSSRQQPLRPQTGPLQRDPGSLGQHWEPVRDGLARQGSYTEVQLGTPQPTETVSITSSLLSRKMCASLHSIQAAVLLKRKDYAFRHQFNEKLRTIPGCPGAGLLHTSGSCQPVCDACAGFQCQPLDSNQCLVLTACPDTLAPHAR